jgi:hypothetical protein
VSTMAPKAPMPTTTTKLGARTPPSVATPSRWSHACHFCLLSIIALQWLLLTILLNSRHHRTSEPVHPASLSKQSALSPGQLAPSENHARSQRNLPFTTLGFSNSTARAESSGTPQVAVETRTFPGVAATVIFRAPRWFHLRYTLMIHNALENIPSDWALQIFINEKWVQKELLHWHPGLVRLMNSEKNPRIIVTPLPGNLVLGKPKQVLTDAWFWNNVVAEKVFLFSGNGALCGNHAESIWDMLSSTDYCAAPWPRHDGNGGYAGTHSYRNKTAILQVLQHLEQSNEEREIKKVRSGDVDFVGVMLEMNRQGLSNFRVATADQTMQFGGGANLSVGDTLDAVPLAVSGTQASFTYKQRDSLLKHCPELKMIFPSLHEPACFGAHPVKDQCQATICALQEPLPKQGC